MTTENSEMPAQSFPDPISLLEQLDPSLEQDGSIKSTKEEVSKLVSLMKGSQMLVSRCVILNVIKTTSSQPTLTRLMDAGGWPILNVWLVEAKKTQNIALTVELLQVLQKLPVTIAALKQGTMGKLIKQLSKQDNQEVKALASELLTSWMAIFRDGQTGKPTSSKSTSGDSSTTAAAAVPGGVVNDRKTSTSSVNDEDAKKSSADSAKKDKKSSSSKKKSSKNSNSQPPIEACQPPPGPLVALGKPRDKPIKRSRPGDILVHKSQVPPEKKTKQSPITVDKSGKGLVESFGFMNALSSQVLSDKMKTKKVKKNSSKGTANKLAKTNSNSDGGGGKTDVTTPTQTTSDGMSAGSGDGEVKSSEEMEVQYGGEQSNKKRVSWAEETSLVSVHYFELDESERVNVNRPKSFLDAAQHEKMREREARESGLMFSRDRLIEMCAWTRPSLMDLPPDLIERGSSSEQKAIQSVREGKVLAQLFLSKSSLPPTPTEPDPEDDITESEPKMIPLNEPNAPPGSNQPPMFTSPPPPVAHPLHRPSDSPLHSPANNSIHPPHINYFNEMNNTPFNNPPGPNGALHMQNPHFQGGDSNYMQYQQGFPPSQGDQWAPPPPPIPLPPTPQGLYGDPNFQGHNGIPFRRGHGSGFRGRGRGFNARGRGNLEARICKHFITHGCKLGNSCKFLHCTLDDLANKMATNESTMSNGPLLPPPPGARGGSSGLREEYMDSPSRHHQNNSPSNVNSFGNNGTSEGSLRTTETVK